jgi:hypothetical protein
VAVGALLLVNGTDNLLLSNATDDLLLASSTSIDATLLTSSYDNVDRTSYTTASISPAADSLLLVFVCDSIAAGTAPRSVVSGLSLTWTQIGTKAWSAGGVRRSGAWIAQCGSSPGSGTLTLTEQDEGSGTTSTGTAWAVIQITGHHVASPVRQIEMPLAIDNASAVANHFVNISDPIDSNSRPFAFFAARVNAALTGRTNWTELSDDTSTAPIGAFQTQWRSDAFETTASATWTGSGVNRHGIVVEIAAAAAAAAVTYASVAGSAETSGVATSPVSANMPSGITAGELLVAIVGTDGAATAAAGGAEGWTQVNTAANASAVRETVLAKVAAGGDALTLTLGSAVDSATQVMRITNHGVSNVATDIAVGTAATGTDTAPNPPSVTPAANTPNLFIAFNASDDDDNPTENYWPASAYTAAGWVESAQSGTSCMIQVAYRRLTTGSAENPPAFVLGASEEWVAQTLCIPPASAGATGTAAVTEEADTSTASGTETFTGTSATTEAADTSTASGTLTITGTSATTEEADTATASGTHTENVTGSAAATEEADTSTATGTETFTGTSATTEADDTSSATGAETFTGTAAVTEADDTSTASGTVGSVGGISATIHPVSTLEPAAAVSTLEPATTVHTFAPATTVRTFNA